jgi:hypothetical protein
MKPVDFHHGLTMLNYQSDDVYLMIVGFYIPSFGRFITTTPDQPAEYRVCKPFAGMNFFCSEETWCEEK